MRHVVVNSVGREIETISGGATDEGRQIQLTLDADLQQAGEDAFLFYGYSGGAAVALDPQNGEVLALVSLPAYDPNDFALGIDAHTWSSLNTNPLRPLQNRVLQGRYPPGSTFKIVMATAALEEGHYFAKFQGYVSWRRDVLRSILSLPLDPRYCGTRRRAREVLHTYFYTLGRMLDVDVINRWAAELGSVC